MKLPLVNTSASWFLVSTCLIWIMGSKLIPSKNQSRATLWVLETCLIVGLLSAFDDNFDRCFNVFKDVQPRFALRRICVCGNVVHTRQLINVSVSLLFGFGFVTPRTIFCCWVGWCLVLFDECNSSITTSHKPRASNPSIRDPTSNEMISIV